MEALRVIAECVNSKKLSKLLLDQFEAIKYLFFSLSFCKDMTNIVFEAIFLRFKGDRQFYIAMFDCCGEIVTLSLPNSNQTNLELKYDLLSIFLGNSDVRKNLVNIKNKAFDYLEYLLK